MNNISEKNIILLERQLVDIQSQAEKILLGENSSHAIETFSKYSEEMKIFIEMNITNTAILERTREIEKINFKRNELKLWQYVTFSFWFVMLMQYIAKQKSIEEIGRVKSQYSSLYMLYKELYKQDDF